MGVLYMSLLETFIGPAVKATYDLGKYIVTNIFKEENEELVTMVNKAIDGAITRFFEKYGNQFGEPSSCFLVRRDNWDIIVRACFYDQKWLTWRDIDPRGFDNAPSATQEAIEFFIICLKEQMSKYWKLDKILREKGFYEKTEEKLDTISTTQMELKDGLNHFAAEINSSISDNSVQLVELARGVEAISRGISSTDISINLMTTEFQAELKYAEDLIDNNKPSEALLFLNPLKDRIWNQAQPVVRFKLLTNMAAAHLAFAKYELAGRLLVEALQYQPTEENAIRNAGYGYLIMNMPEQAIQKAKEVLILNPVNSSAYSIIIQATSINTDFSTLLSTIPEALRNSPEIAYALGVFSNKQGSEAEAEKWFGIAVENDKESRPEALASLGSIILDSMTSDHGVVIGKQIDSIKKKRIEKAVELLSKAWEKVNNTQLREVKVAWLYNRALGHRMLGRINDAEADIEVAVSIDPANIEYQKQKAAFALEKRNWAKAVSIFEVVPFDSSHPEIPLLLAQALANNGELPKAINIIDEYLRIEGIPSEFALDARRLLMHIYLDMDKLESAKLVLDQLKQLGGETDIQIIVDSAEFEKAQKGNNSAIAMLIEAVALINDLTPYNDIQRLADVLYNLREYDVASQVYARITNTNCDSPILHRYLIALYKSGKSGKALEICRIANHDLVQRFYAEMEAVILQDTGNLPEARAVCEKYLKNNPDDLEIKLRLAIINNNSRNYEALDDFLHSKIDTSILPAELAVLLSKLYWGRDMHRESLELCYELRRNIGTGEMHSNYISTFFSISATHDDWLTANEVKVDTAAIVESDTGRRETYFIVDRKDAILAQGEITPANIMAQRLLGKKVGDNVVLKDGPFTRRSGKIVEIKTKFVHALHESLALTENDLVNIPGFFSIPIGKPMKEGALPEGLDAIIKTDNERQEFLELVEKTYKNGNITLGTFARLIDKDVIDVWEAVVNRPDIGLRASYVNTPINISAEITIDVIALLTIHGLNVQDQVAKCLGEIGIGQSTVDLLSNKVSQLKSFGVRGFLTIEQSGDSYVKDEVSVDNVIKTVEHYERILSWIDKHCKVLPCNAILDFERKQKLEWDDKIGKAFIESILIAQETKSLLFSDDLTLRLFAQSFKVEGLWTQQVLDICLKRGHLEKTAYNEAVLRLILSNYQYPAINTEILLHSIKSEGKINVGRFEKVSQLLGGNYCEPNSAIQVSVQFLYELFKQADLALHNDIIVQTLIKNLVNNRDSKMILKELAVRIHSRFLLLPIVEKRIIETIELWKKSHFIDF